MSLLPHRLASRFFFVVFFPPPPRPPAHHRHLEQVRALDAGTGGVLWTFPTKGEVQSSPRISKDGAALYIGSYDGNIYKLNTADGPVLFPL
jgi:outer membrane protein assembly factor BamB